MARQGEPCSRAVVCKTDGSGSSNRPRLIEKGSSYFPSLVADPQYQYFRASEEASGMIESQPYCFCSLLAFERGGWALYNLICYLSISKACSLASSHR